MSNLLKILACLIALQSLMGCTVTTNSGTKTYSVADILNAVDETLSGDKSSTENSGYDPQDDRQPILRNKVIDAPLPAKRLDWTSLLNAQMQLKPNFDFEEHADSYMRIFRPTVWNKYRNDEFELASKRRETVAMMKQSSTLFNSDDLFLIQTSFDFGHYDFSREVFPLDSISESSFFTYSKSWSRSLPGEYRLEFTNASMIGDLHMNEAAAKSFLQKRKNRSGKINRKVYAKVFFSNIKTDGIKNIFKADIQNVYIYSDSDYRLLLAKY